MTISISPSHHEVREAQQRFVDVKLQLAKATLGLAVFAPQAPGQPSDYETRRQLARDVLEVSQKQFDEVGSVEAFALQLAERRVNDPTAAVRGEFLISQVDKLRSKLAAALSDFDAQTLSKNLAMGEVFEKWEAVVVAEAALIWPVYQLQTFYCVQRGEPVLTSVGDDPEATKFARTGFDNAVNQLLARRTALSKEASDAEFNASYSRAIAVTTKVAK